MEKYITRKIARAEVSKFTVEDVRRINNNPLMCASTCYKWKDDLGSYIESAYDGKSRSFEEITTDFNSNYKRKFAKSDGTVIGFCRVLTEYLNYMCLAVNSGKRYTAKQFNAFLSNYKEVYA